MIGDFGGGGPGATENAASIKAAGTDFIQTVGDNVYPSSGLPDPDFATTYSDFDQRFKPFGPTIKDQGFFPANGNKEYYGDGSGGTPSRCTAATTAGTATTGATPTFLCSTQRFLTALAPSNTPSPQPISLRIRTQSGGLW